ncbi:dihydroneopterin aldolase [Halopseudomonas xinjiangensis]|uniref:7,8-dihydroneopterin aldolase n=1 Tax=Halopseudomonas xinjiangensis TaxID=487184 RepID=A0A1H1Z1C6_9GAMM|nr:dihydroneopterin aldolase [Halopseudomonas xinjiangensis]SDT27605.1 dihydroneopterin aldolase [Halopseudomonas xinjiangensis]
MDQVFINGLSVDAVIGVYDWERIAPQRLIIDLDMGWDMARAAAEDDITATLDYAAISQRIAGFAAASSCALVETFADRLASAIICEFGVPWLRLRVTKPGAVPEALGGVGVLIERGARLS